MTNSNSLTIGQAAALLDRSERWVQQRAAEGWIRKTERGQYALVSLIRGAIAYQEDQLAKARKAADATRATAARTKEIELRIAERMRKLVPRHDVETEMEVLVSDVRAEARGMGARITPDLKLRRTIDREASRVIALARSAADAALTRLTVGPVD